MTRPEYESIVVFMSTLEDLYNSIKKRPCPTKQDAGLKMSTETLLELSSKAKDEPKQEVRPKTEPKPEPIKPQKAESDFKYENDFAVSSHNKLNHKDAIFRIFAPQKVGENVGSGFFCTPSGEFLTDLHVVGDAKTFQIVLSNGQRLTGVIDGSDPSTDLAGGHVVNSKTSLPYLKFEKSRTLEPNKSTTYTAGYAYGRDFQLLPGKFRNMSYVGVVSDGDLESGEDPRRSVILSDNFTPPAMSGGVIFNADFVPIGIIDKGDIANKGFTSKTISTPIEDGLKLLKQLRGYQMDSRL